MTINKQSPTPWVLSLATHGILLLILGFLLVKPVLSQQWYEFRLDEWDQDKTVPPPEQVQIAPVPVRNSAQPVSRGQQTPSRTESPIPDVRSGNVYPGPSEILETPTLPRVTPNATQYSVGDNPYAQSAIRGILDGDPSGDGSVAYAITGGRVRFRLPAGYKHNIGSSGSATVQFRVDRLARLIPGSIISIQHTEGRFFEAAKKVLMDGTFSFDGPPEPDVVCRITLDFL